MSPIKKILARQERRNCRGQVMIVSRNEDRPRKSVSSRFILCSIISLIVRRLCYQLGHRSSSPPGRKVVVVGLLGHPKVAPPCHAAAQEECGNAWLEQGSVHGWSALWAGCMPVSLNKQLHIRSMRGVYLI